MAHANTRSDNVVFGKMLTPKEIRGYRQWLAELDEEARAADGNFNTCDAEVWECFDAQSDIGKQDNTIDAKGQATRAEVASILMRYIQNIAE